MAAAVDGREHAEREGHRGRTPGRSDGNGETASTLATSAIPAASVLGQRDTGAGEREGVVERVQQRNAGDAEHERLAGARVARRRERGMAAADMVISGRVGGTTRSVP